MSSRPQFTPCANCAPQFSPWNNQREADFRRGLSNALETVLGEKVTIEDLRGAWAVNKALDAPEYAHVAAAMDHAFALGAEKTGPLLKGDTVNAEDKALFDKQAARIEALENQVKTAGGTASQVSVDFTLDRGEREIRRMYPNATDEQVSEFFDKHVRTQGYVTRSNGGAQTIDWGATARAWMPEVFAGAAPTGATASEQAAGALSRPSGNGMTTREEPTEFSGPKEGEGLDTFKERARSQFHAQVSAQEG